MLIKSTDQRCSCTSEDEAALLSFVRLFPVAEFDDSNVSSSARVPALKDVDLDASDPDATIEPDEDANIMLLSAMIATLTNFEAPLHPAVSWFRTSSFLFIDSLS